MYSCSTRGTNIAKVEDQWLDSRPNCSVPDTQTTAPRFMGALLIYFPPPIAWEIIVTSFYDIMIICSTFSMGKPLCMCRGNAIVHPCICQHHCQNSQLLWLHPNLIVFSLTQILCLWHSPPGCTFIQEPWFIYNVYNKTQAYITSKQGWWMQNIK